MRSFLIGEYAIKSGNRRTIRSIPKVSRPPYPEGLSSLTRYYQHRTLFRFGRAVLQESALRALTAVLMSHGKPTKSVASDTKLLCRWPFLSSFCPLFLFFFLPFRYSSIWVSALEETMLLFRILLPVAVETQSRKALSSKLSKGFE